MLIPRKGDPTHVGGRRRPRENSCNYMCRNAKNQGSFGALYEMGLLSRRRRRQGQIKFRTLCSHPSWRSPYPLPSCVYHQLMVARSTTSQPAIWERRFSSWTAFVIAVTAKRVRAYCATVLIYLGPCVMHRTSDGHVTLPTRKRTNVYTCQHQQGRPTLTVGTSAGTPLNPTRSVRRAVNAAPPPACPILQPTPR